MKIDSKEINSFAAYCNSTYNINNIYSSSEALQEALYDAWKKLQTAPSSVKLGEVQVFPEWEDKNVNVALPNNGTPKSAKVVSPPLGKIKNDTYNLHARVVTKNGSPTYSLILLVDDLKKMGRTRKPRFPLKPNAKYPKLYSHLKKLWFNNREIFELMESHKKDKKYQYDSTVPVCSASVLMREDANSINSLTDIKLFDLVAKSVSTSVAAPVSVLMPASLPNNITLQIFTKVISKNDPLLIEDKMLQLWRYHPQNTKLSDKDQEDIRGRIGEVVFRSENPLLEWVNENMEQGDYFDYKVPGSKLTVDVKTICSPTFNLLLKRKKVETNSLADIFSLLLVEDIGNEYQVSCYGFISKEDSLRFITAYPRCLIPKIDSYKIERRQLDPQFVIEIK